MEIVVILVFLILILLVLGFRFLISKANEINYSPPKIHESLIQDAAIKVFGIKGLLKKVDEKNQILYLGKIKRYLLVIRFYEDNIVVSFRGASSRIFNTTLENTGASIGISGRGSLSGRNYYRYKKPSLPLYEETYSYKTYEDIFNTFVEIKKQASLILEL
jgi:hypothetical protein